MGDVWNTYESPLGPLTVVSSAAGALRALRFPGGPAMDEAGRAPMPSVFEQLDQYFAGERRRFDLGVEFSGTPLQIAGLGAAAPRSPTGRRPATERSSADVDPAAFPAPLEPHERARAVGTEIGRTPVPIVIPCHRVVGADGSLTGYGGGLDRKRALLELESSQLALI